VEKNIEFVILLDTYEKLLTETQSRILRMRFDEDLSLGEIGELCGISRQAVRDAIVKGEQKLLFYEQTLKVAKRERELSRVINELEQANTENSLEYAELLKSILEEQ